MGALEAAVFALCRAVQASEISPGQAHGDLAQLEARLDKLQCDGIDSVDTTPLAAADRESARHLRRDLTRRADQLHGQIDGTFAGLKALKAAAAAS